MNTDELGRLLCLCPATLYVQRRRGDGPPWERCGARHLYRRTSVFAWLESCRRDEGARPSTPRRVDVPLLTEDEAAVFLGIERRDLLIMRGMVNDASSRFASLTVPHYKLGRAAAAAVRYRREDLTAFKRTRHRNLKSTHK